MLGCDLMHEKRPLWVLEAVCFFKQGGKVENKRTHDEHTCDVGKFFEWTVNAGKINAISVDPNYLVLRRERFGARGMKMSYRQVSKHILAKGV